MKEETILVILMGLFLLLLFLVGIVSDAVAVATPLVMGRAERVSEITTLESGLRTDLTV